MYRSLLILLVSIVLVSPAGLVSAEQAVKNLVPVKSEYAQDAQAPASPEPVKSAGAPSPTPAEQMYVFWMVGKVLSYPIDTLEGYVRRLMEAPHPKVVPASAPATRNPFEARDLGQIPPAPPVLGKPISGR